MHAPETRFSSVVSLRPVSLSRYKEELSASRWQGCICSCSLLTLEPWPLKAFSHPSLVGLLLALREFVIMTRDGAITKPYTRNRFVVG